MAKNPDNRKKAVVNPRVQWTLATRVVIHFFVFVCAGAVFGLINQFLADPFAGASENLAAFWKSCGPMLIALVCLMPIFIRDTLTLSNRIAGPIHNMKNTIRRIAAGERDVRPLKFRKGDLWDDLPDLFNSMVDRLRKGQAGDSADCSSEAAEQRELVEA